MLSSVSAAHEAKSGARLIPELIQAGRSEFQRDRERILHSAAFRRLAHKTQVFVGGTEGDHVRSRLTHTIEVAQIARDIARRLGLCEDLAETIALAHDLGHPPFGHAGEDALDEALREWGGFDHNAQALAVVMRLEHRYAAFDGLNLTYATIEGILAHNGPMLSREGDWIGKHPDRDPPAAIVSAAKLYGLDLTRYASAEAQAAAVADDIAYNCHDVEDGVRSGILDPNRLREVPLISKIWREANLDMISDPDRRIHELLRRMMSGFVEDVLATARQRLKDCVTVANVRDADEPVIGFSDEMAAHEKILKAWLRKNLYRHDALMTETNRGQTCVKELVERLLADPCLLPERWSLGVDDLDKAGVAGRVRDYVSGMTDRFAQAEMTRLDRLSDELNRPALNR
ncbi:deoxyguanosinetriphosphate triphosphohydrolase family protein [Bosea sp. RAC05]|uniref:deoxyguanosinetriphosphate triphosphohydrolase family protein n=1 Tax=Bosea sp. RAC05 TaxID=1842539 RepID=UPI00083E1CBE|nr:dNTP triphosphohydrolase [Bosea sp. RAC05]AOG03017.1 dGTPase family protein [Bosea sp. RAC05]